MPRNLMLAPIALLAACQTAEPGVTVRTVSVPTPVACLPLAEIPAEPPLVADQLNGVPAHDLPIVAASALRLRAVVQEMRAALLACGG